MDIVGKTHFTDALIDLVSYSYDASDHDHRPAAAVWPTSADQVSRILKLAGEQRLAEIDVAFRLGELLERFAGLARVDIAKSNDVIPARDALQVAVPAATRPDHGDIQFVIGRSRRGDGGQTQRHRAGASRGSQKRATID